MSLRVYIRDRIPGDGFWNFVHPQTGKEFHVHHDFDELLRQVKAYHVANDFPIPLDFDKWVEEGVCRQQPSECYEPIPSDLPLRPMRLDYSDVLHGVKVLLPFAMAGMPLVSDEEATRRAAICAKCPLNVAFAISGCGACAELANLVKKIIGNRTTGKVLFACAICHCELASAVWVPLEYQCRGVTAEMKPMFAKMKELHNCWKQCEG